MRSGFSIMLIMSLLFAGGYFYILAKTICPIPVSYRIGQLDERFGLTHEEAKAATAEAALVWEETIGQTLFTYDEKADFAVNFIFDERQELIIEEGVLKDSLDTVENVNDALNETHALLTAQYEQLKELYEAEIASYDRRLATYEQTVDQYNQNGGATADVRDELEAERASLQAQQAALEAQAQEINALVEQINDLGAQGNALVDRYNENVGEFNERFGESREFTQGDYRGDHINIYTFADMAELQTVLAHEFGHALSLDHVEGAESVMHYLIGEQPVDLQLSETDVAEFKRICEEMSLWDKIVYKLNSN